MKYTHLFNPTTPSRPSGMGMGMALAALALAWGCGDEPVNQPPLLSSLPGELSLKTGETLDLTITADDPDGDPVKLSLEAGPPGAEFIAPGALGRFHWAPLASDARDEPHEIIFAASDGRGGKATARVAVLVESADGAPRFVTSPQRVLDLSQTDTLRAEVLVKDDDSSQVTLTLENAPKGMDLVQVSPKGAELTWTPNAEQIDTQVVWAATIVADDGDSGRVSQTLSVILITKAECGEGALAQCSCAPPSIAHNELADQRGLEDYVVRAEITDAQSRVRQATLFYTQGDPEDLEGYESVEMVGAGSTFEAAIPNPLLEAGQTASIAYFICAVDDDDAAGEVCDNLICAPEDSRFRFTAFPVGDQSCAQDDHEPDNTPQQAAPVEANEGLFGLTLCQGDVDLFPVEVPAGADVGVLMTYTAANGNLGARLFAPDGRTVLAAEDTAEDDEFLLALNVAVGGTYVVEVAGDPNSYDLFFSVIGPSDGCLDASEPNDTPQEATPLDAGQHPGLQICGGDVDFFLVEVPEGGSLTATATFSHAAGDLDMKVYVPGVDAPVGTSLSVTDNERVALTGLINGEYLIEVFGFGNAANTYALNVEIGGDNPVECTEDDTEPNDTPDEAFPIINGDTLDLALCPDDPDHFSLNLLRGQRAEVRIGFDGDVGDLDLELLAPDGTTSLQLSAGIEDTERVRHTALEDGDHVVRVEGFEGAAAPYQLQVRVCNNDPGDPNDEPAQATPLLLTGLDNGRVLCLGEADWYSLGAEAGTVLLLDVILDSALGAEAVLYQSDGRTVLARPEVDGDTLSFLVDIPTTGTYLLRVQGLDGGPAANNYSLLVEND